MGKEDTIVYKDKDKGDVTLDVCKLRNDYTGFCNHPQVHTDSIKCDYSLTEIIVPKDCPLKKSDIIIKLESENMALE